MAAVPKQIASELTRVGVLASNPDVCAQLQACLWRLPVQVVLEERTASPDSRTLTRLQNLHPALVLVEQPSDRAAISNLVRTLNAAVPGAAIVLVNSCADSEAILESVHAGARDYLYPPFDQSLAGAVARLELQVGQIKAVSGPECAQNRVIGFLSAKGGCGATTVAVHAAVDLGRESGNSTALADFDLTCGMVRFLTKAQNQYTAADAANNSNRLDDSFWTALVSKYSGVDVLAGVGPFAGKPNPDEQQFAQVLQFMRSRYAWSVIDLGRGIHSFSASLLDCFDELFVVSTPDWIALAQAKQVADRLRRGCGFHAVHLILNRCQSREAISVPEAESLTGLDVYTTLPDSDTDIREALLNGRLVADKTQLSKQFSVLTRRMAGLSQSEEATGLVSAGRKLWAKIFKGTRGRVETMEAPPENPWESLSRAGEAALEAMQFEVAAINFMHAVEEAEKSGEDDARLGRILSRLGVAQCHQRYYAEAERTLKRAAHLLEQALGPADPALLEALTSLAGAYKSTGEYETARQLYDRVLKAAEALTGPKHPMIAWTLDGLGDVHVAQGEAAAALYAYRRALAIKEDALGPSDWDVAVTLDKISGFYYQHARYNEAEPLMWRSIEIQTTVLGQGAPALAKRYIKLGTLYATQRKYTEAERLLRYGISISSATETADDIVPCLHKLAEVYEGLARFRSAEGVRSLAHSLMSSSPDAERAFAREFKLTPVPVPRPATNFNPGYAPAVR